ncbi:hypothetical protein LSAT2_031234 [Lamellibrachia satsuma]|nr:hypothetical protein LSAT2_031234 [Lamellibrachia satsuma]
MHYDRTRQQVGDHKQKRQVPQTQSQLSQTVVVPTLTDRGSPSCHRPWKSQLSQTVEVPAVTDRGSPRRPHPGKPPPPPPGDPPQLSQTVEAQRHRP